MKRFRYRLESVLGHRRGLLRERQQDLAAARYEVARMEQALLGLELRRRECQEQVRRSALGELDRTEVLRSRTYANSLWLRLLAGAQDLAKLRAHAEDRRRAMVSAKQGVRALEILRDKSEQAWSRESAREERRFLDDLGRESGLAAPPVGRGGQSQ